MSNSSGSRTNLIQEILANRKTKAKETENTIAHLDDVARYLDNFSLFMTEILSKDIGSDVRSRLTELREQLKEPLDTALRNCRSQLTQLLRRFERPTLNIGIVGNARQGKSTLLQKLTGLNDDVIPSGNRGHCTGAASIIYHASNFHAKIEFYTEIEFIEEVIHPYYDANELGDFIDLGDRPSSLMAFKKTLYPETPRWKEGKNDENKRILYSNLRKRQQQLPLYESLLNAHSVDILTQGEEIRQYVAQETKDHQPLGKWNAVKLATIHVPYPADTEIGSIAVCDTPGLGDFVCGAEKKLIQTVGNNIDAVVMLKKVSDTCIFKKEDADLYGLIPKAIRGLDNARDWSYFIVNKATKDQGLVDHLLGEIKTMKIETRLSPFVFNCTEPKEVGPFLDELLTDIAKNQPKLDDILYKNRVENVKNLVADIEAFIKIAQDVLPASQKGAFVGDSNLNRVVDENFPGIWDTIVNELSDLLESFQHDKDSLRESYEKRLDEIHLRLQSRQLNDEIDPSKSDKTTVDRIKAKYKSSQPMAFWAEQLQRFRLELTSAFNDLNSILFGKYIEMKDEVWAILGKSGLLANILPSDTPNDDAESSLLQLADQWQRCFKKEDEIVDVIRYFANSTFSFRAFLLPRVRDNLQSLLDKSAAANDYKPKTNDDMTLKGIYVQLQAAWDNAVSQTYDALYDLSGDLFLSRYTTLEVFEDGIIRSGGFTEPKERWQKFYRHNAPFVWPKEIGVFESQTRLWEAYHKHVSNIENALNLLKTK